MSKHQYAYNNSGNWVNAKEILYSKTARYFCECPQRHILKIVKPSGNLGKRKFCDYFAHITKKQRTAHSSAEKLACFSSAGESLEHRNAKHMLREMQGLYTFSIKDCPCCSKTAVYEDCLHGKISIEVRSVDGKWRYDCLLERDDGTKLAMEIAHTHFTTAEKILATRLSGIEIAEFKASDVLNMTNGCRLENLQANKFKCMDCLVQGGIQWLSDMYKEEIQIICEFENLLDHGHYVIEKRHLEYLKMIQRDKDWIVWCWENEVDIIKDLDKDIATDYQAQWVQLEFRKSLIGMEVMNRAKMIFRHYLQEIYIIHPIYGEIQIDNIWKEDNSGFYIKNGQWMGNAIGNQVNQDLYIYFFNDENDIKGNAWKPDGIIRKCVMFVRTLKVIADLSKIETQIRNYDHHEFKDCKWPILKRLENTFFGSCANCGIPGHTSERCRQKECTRCGRKGHSCSNCFARTRANGCKI